MSAENLYSKAVVSHPYPASTLSNVDGRELGSTFLQFPIHLLISWALSAP